MDKEEALAEIKALQANITGIQQQAAEKILEQQEALIEAYDELERIYELTAIMHFVANMYLDQDPVGETEEQAESILLVRDAVAALENGETLAQARLIREEEEED